MQTRTPISSHVRSGASERRLRIGVECCGITLAGGVAALVADNMLVACAALHCSLVWLDARTRHDFLAPTVLTSAVLALYSWSAAVFAFGTTPPLYAAETLYVFIAAVTAGQLGLWIGGSVVVRRRAEKDDTRTLLKSERRCVALGVVMIAAILLLNGPTGRFTDSVQAYTDVAASQRTDARASSVSGLSAYASEIPLILLLFALTVSVTSSRVTVVWRLLTIALSAFVVIQSVRAGSKFEPIIFVLGSAIAAYYVGGETRPWKLVVLTLALYPFAVMISHVRFTTNPNEMVSAALRDIEWDPGVLAPYRSGELVGPPQTLMVLAESIRGDHIQFTLTRPYVDELSTWIPRFVWPNRPRPLAEQYMAIVHPVADSEGRGEGFFILTTGYWAAGLVGVFLELLLYGFLLAVCHRMVSPFLHRPTVAALYAPWLFWTAVMVVRTGTIGALKAAVMWEAPLVVLGILAGIWSPPWNRHPSRTGGRSRRPSLVGVPRHEGL